MCKSGLQKVLTVTLSVLMNGTQGSPSMSLHRAWVFWLYQNPNSPTPPPALCLHHVVWPLVTQAVARAQDGPDAAPMGPSFLLPALLSALQLLTTVPLPVAGKGLWLPTPPLPQSPPQACLVPQKSGLLIREMASCRGPSCCFQQCPAHKRCSPTDE